MIALQPSTIAVTEIIIVGAVSLGRWGDGEMGRWGIGNRA